jgi:predicted Rossmann fold flavoprotein
MGYQGRLNMLSANQTKVIVVGGGASGIMAAISAKRSGADVTILERNPRIGKKILATGNGRCNFTNIHTDVSHYNGKNPKFIYGALYKFDVSHTIAFFEKLGIAHKVEESGKAFPMSDQASSVLDCLMYELNETGVKVLCNSYVKNVEKNKRGFQIYAEDGSAYQCDSVVLAAGGKAMPSTGSDGNGYDIARILGHKIVDVFPALVQLKLEGPYYKQIQGTKFVGTTELIYNNKSVAKDRGDILFTNYGISGPPILQLSRKAGEFLKVGKEAMLKVAIIDSMTREELNSYLTERFKNMPRRTVELSLVGFVNKRLIPVILKEAGIKDLKSQVANISVKERDKIAGILTDWRFKVRGTKSWQSAQVTAGGVDTSEINPNTMESNLVKGLFFAGEIIDIDGQSGGFNLQWAWSSGFLAGQCAATINKSPISWG